jgi:Cytochrome c554 and c-prime
MRGFFVLLAVAAGALIVVGLDRSRAEKPAAVAVADEPASKQAKPSPPKDDTPLLLDDDDADAKPKKTPGADNSRCFVCHLNYQTEALATTHARANIGCARCHGASDAHIADESWASGGNGTAPDTMYPAAKINQFCMTCHDLTRADDKITCPFPRLSADEKKVCTDCHGKHRLAKRKCKWK